jgi:hypothetical protein
MTAASSAALRAMNFVPRDWQKECLQRFQERLDSGANTFVLEACMGAGKSAVAAMIAEALLRQDVIDHVLVLVPWKSIQGDPEKGMLGAFGSFNWMRAGSSLVQCVELLRSRYPKWMPRSRYIRKSAMTQQ